MDIQELRERIRQWKAIQGGEAPPETLSTGRPAPAASALQSPRLASPSPMVASPSPAAGPSPAPTTSEIAAPDDDLDVMPFDDEVPLDGEDEEVPLEVAPEPEPEQVAEQPQAAADPHALAQQVYAQLSPEHLAALQQYGQQLAAQGYAPEQIAAAQFQYAQQMVVAIQQAAAQAAGGGQGQQ